MKKITLPLKRSPLESWREVFLNPRPLTVESFQTGSVILNKQGTLNHRHPRAQDIKREKLKVPILAHWVHHQDKGDYLLDVGLDASYYKDPTGGIGGPFADEFLQKRSQNIAFYLEKRQIKLKGVFLSHLHSDHIAGLRELPKNIPYVVGKGEYRYYLQEEHGDFLKGLEVLYEIDFPNSNIMLPLGPSADLLGDGSLWAIWTPGHTPGHMSFLVNGMERPILLAMDACFIGENLQRGVASSSYTWDVEMAQETLEKIVKFHEIYPQARVGAGHEVLK